MAKDYKFIAKEVLKNIGGQENVKEFTHCVTRLRFVVIDHDKVNKKNLEAIEGVLTVLEAGGQTQVVIGQDVAKAYDEVLALKGMERFSMDANTSEEASENTSEESLADITAANKKKTKKNIFGDKFVEYVSAIFTPFMEAFMGAGLLKGFVVLFVTLGILSKDSSTYTILYSVADAIFYFFPIFIGYSAGKKFGAKPFVTMAIAAALVYPNLIALASAQTAVTFIGIPVKMIIFGVHWGLIPICMNNYAVLGYDYILPLTVGTNFGIAAATFAVAILTKDRKTREMSATAGVSALIGGVTEPAIYGVLLSRKKLFATMCVVNGIGGALCAVMHVTRDVQMSVNLFTLPAIYAVYGVWGIVAIVISIVGAFVAGLVVISREIKGKGKKA